MDSTRPALDESASDGDLALAIMKGLGAAESRLVARFRRRVFLYGMRHLRDEAKAEDLAQEVMATTLVRLRAGEVTEPARIGSFILGMARHMARADRRRERRGAEVALAAAREGLSHDPPREVLDLEPLATGLGALTERERAIVVLTFMEDRSAQEIAEALRMQPGHVRVVRHRAVARLTRLLGVDEGAAAEEGS